MVGHISLAAWQIEMRANRAIGRVFTGTNQTRMVAKRSGERIQNALAMIKDEG
jgi:hypothetical protein